MKIVYLEPESTFRTKLKSDTLWGIICWAIRNVYGNDELEKFLKTYSDGNPEFIISSTFPYFENTGKKEHYFPKPNTKEVYIEQDSIDRKTKIQNARNRKKLKKVQQLELADFEKFISEPNNITKIIKDLSELKKSFSLKSESTAHNTINRLTGGTLKLEKESGQLFHIDEYFFNINSDKIEVKEDKTENDKKAGLFFLVKGDTEKLEAALRFLNHIGYGGDRNTGKGKFKFEMKDFSIKEPKDFNAYINLSLYYPTKEEVEKFKGNEFFNYQIEERQGFTSFNKYEKTYKPITLMFAEGSVFPKIDKNIFGENKIVMNKSEKQPHDVFQYGFGFMIKIKI